jgi:hypothetical protein
MKINKVNDAQWYKLSPDESEVNYRTEDNGDVVTVSQNNPNASMSEDVTVPTES